MAKRRTGNSGTCGARPSPYAPVDARAGGSKLRRIPVAWAGVDRHAGMDRRTDRGVGRAGGRRGRRRGPEGRLPRRLRGQGRTQRRLPDKGEKRAFVVYPPQGAKGPAPVFVPLTGSVGIDHGQPDRGAQRRNVPDGGAGFLVIGPVRECAGQDPNLKAGVCNGPGHGGWNWNPWREGRAAGPRASLEERRGPELAVPGGGGEMRGKVVPGGCEAHLRRRDLVGRHDDQPGADLPLRLLGGRPADLRRVVRDEGRGDARSLSRAAARRWPRRPPGSTRAGSGPCR